MDEKLAQLTALQETTRAMVSTLELDELLNLIIQQAANLLRAEGGILNLVDWERREDEVYACTGSFSGVLGWRSPLDGSLSGWVTLHNQPVISNQIREDPRIDPQAGSFMPQLLNAAVAPLTIKERVTGSLVLVNKRGGQAGFEQADLDLLVSFAHQAASAIENARLYAAERRRAEQFRAIAEVSRRLALIYKQEQVYQQVVSIIQQVFGYECVAISLMEGDELVTVARAGDCPGAYPPDRIKLGQSAWSRAARRGDAYLSTPTPGEPACLFVPLKYQEAVTGVLSTASSRLNAFDESDRALLQTLAHQAAVLVENLRYHERAQHLAVMEERSRLARELHDAVTQTIFSTSMLAEALPDAWEEDPQQGRLLIQQVRSLSRAALAEMRTLLLELRPAALVETPLEDLLRQLGEAASGREGIPVHVVVEGQGALPAEVHIALFRIAQEAVNNVVKHAGASQVTLRLLISSAEGEQPGGLSALLIVRDDGCGFEPAQVSPEHLGLGIMQERADAIGASLNVESHSGEGTQVTLLWEGERQHADS
jgi:nitrate/nitrite-specific signal transduction histidine kinase